MTILSSIIHFLRRGAAPAAVCLLVVGMALMALAQVVWAQDPPSGQDLKNTVEQTVSNRQATQQQKNDWADEKAELVRRYRAAKANVAWLAERKAAETVRAESLDKVLDELSRRLGEADRLEGSLQDTLLVLQGRLAASVAMGLPFLAEERQTRLSLVEAELARPDVDSAEKLRRLLEALQIEAGFASSIEVYQAEIAVGGQNMFADILRLGRLALFWRTPDGSRVGQYDQATGQWSELPGSQKRSISLAMEMATRMRPFEVIELPLGRIAP